jgi:hypothetical protein
MRASSNWEKEGKRDEVSAEAFRKLPREAPWGALRELPFERSLSTRKLAPGCGKWFLEVEEIAQLHYANPLNQRQAGFERAVLIPGYVEP